MALKAAFAIYLCRPFCSFYRAGAKEEMACQGALVLDELVQRGRLTLAQLPASGEKERHLWQQEDKELEKVLCLACPFAVDGCDFHSALRSVATEPCGGYLLLQLLKAAGTISGADLKMATGGTAHVA
jgi:hypothetical protein